MAAAQRIATTLERATHVKHYTLVFLTRENNQVLMGMKKRGFGQGKWNGFGGKVESTDANEAAAASREMEEEANITINENDMENRGTLVFTFANKPLGAMV